MLHVVLLPALVIPPLFFGTPSSSLAESAVALATARSELAPAPDFGAVVPVSLQADPTREAQRPAPILAPRPPFRDRSCEDPSPPRVWACY